MPLPLDDLPARWLRDLALTHTHATRVRYGSILAGVVASLPDGVTLATVDDRALRHYLADRADAGIGVRTQRQTLAALRGWMAWAIREELRRDDPTRRIAWPKLPKRRMPPLTAAQLRPLLKLLRDGPPKRRGVSQAQFRRNRRALLLMLYAALRLSEVGDLDWRDVDMDARLIYVLSGKGDKDRVVPMHRQIWAALDEVDVADRSGRVLRSRTGRPMDADDLGHICGRWLPSMGIAGLTAHSLRRTCAALMRRNGADAETIRDVLGHESLATTQIYLGPDPELLRRGIDRLPDLDVLLEAPPDIRALPRRRAAEA